MNQLIEKKPNYWEYILGDRMACFWLTKDELSWEDGPIHPTARSHEGMGSSSSVKEFMVSTSRWIDDYPGLYEAMKQELRKKGF